MMIYYRGKYQAARDISGRYPVKHFWDAAEPRLLVCEARRMPDIPALKGSILQEVV